MDKYCKQYAKLRSPQTLHDSAYMEYLQSANAETKQNGGCRGVEGGKGGKRSLQINGYSASAVQDEGLEMDAGDGCTTM